MSTDAEDYVKQCRACQVVNDGQPKPTPIKSTPIPEAAWLLIGYDLCSPFPDGSHLLVCVDYYSRYPEVEILQKINSSSITSKLRQLFCHYGAPQEFVTDNGPQFLEKTAFTALLKEFNVHHRRIIPYHPAANGEVEQFNRNLKKYIQAAVTEKKTGECHYRITY